MNENKLSYDLPIFQALRQLREHLKKEGLEIDTRFIDYHGTFCPRCGLDFKLYNRSVKDAASLSAFIVHEQGKAVVYCICKSCAKQLTHSPIVKREPVDTEKRICEKLPDLARDGNPSDEQIKKELDIFKRL